MRGIWGLCTQSLKYFYSPKISKKNLLEILEMYCFYTCVRIFAYLYTGVFNREKVFFVMKIRMTMENPNIVH